MKILLDPILTADPAKCSTNHQFDVLVRHLLLDQKREDMFFYWLVPDWVTEDQMMNEYFQHPNIKYIRIPQHKDRTFEYLRFGDHLSKNLWFYGELWDTDVIITVRAGLAALMKMISGSPRAKKSPWLKAVYVIEEMPLMSFKETVLDFNSDVQDRFTLNGYLAADKVFVCSYHEPKGIMQAARQHYAPSKVMELDSKLKSFVPSKTTVSGLKTPDQYYDPKSDESFCISYVGRMEKANNIDEIKEVMEKQFIMKGTKVDLLVCTVSKTVKSFTDLFDIQFASRDEFWEMARNRMHVMLTLVPGGGYNLSLMEPMFMGTPSIVLDKPWSREILGDEYPFFVKNKTQAYAMLNMFYENYGTMYGQFITWYNDWLIPTYEKRFATDLLEVQILNSLNEFESTREANYKDKFGGKANNDIIKAIVGEMKDDDNMFDAIRRLGEKKILNDLPQKIKDDRLYDWNIVWQTYWNEIRLFLHYYHGYVDGSAEVGHLIKQGK